MGWGNQLLDRTTRRACGYAAIFFLGGFFTVTSTLAETARVLKSDYTVLSDAKSDGTFTCGVHFSAGVQKLDGRFLVVQGSLNNFYYPDRAPVLVVKVSGRRYESGQLSPLPIAFAQIRAGMLDTRPLVQTSGSDGNSRMLVLRDETLFFERYADFILLASAGFWVTLQSTDEQGSVTFQLTGFKEKKAEVLQPFRECELNAINNVLQSQDNN